MEEMPQKTIYMKENTRISHYLPYPVFLLDLSISQTAKTLYALLLNRAMLSQKNRWIDKEGRVFIRFPIEEMSEELDRSLTTVKKALNELDNCGLIDRRREEFAKPNVIYVKILQSDRKVSHIRQESCPYDGQFSDLMTVRNLAPNNYTEITDTEIPDVVMAERKRYGRYQNILLSDEEHNSLAADYPGKIDRYIEEVSIYLKTYNRHYDDYEAGIRLWASRDRKTIVQETKIQDYSAKEDESY